MRQTILNKLNILFFISSSSNFKGNEGKEKSTKTIAQKCITGFNGIFFH